MATGSGARRRLGVMGAAIALGLGGCAWFRQPPPPPPSYLSRTDADMRAVLAALDGLRPQPLATLAPEAARAQPTLIDAVKVVAAREGRAAERPPVAKVANRQVKGSVGELPVRIYTPAGKGPFPVVVYYHGGGWVRGGLDEDDATARALAEEAEAVVVAPAYSLAPEHKFPTAHDDAFAVYRWVQDNPRPLGGKPGRVAVAGEDAGANMAADVALRAKGAKVRQPVYQLLIDPIAGTDTNTRSYRAYGALPPVGRAGMGWLLDTYAGEPTDLLDPRLDLVHSQGFDGVPPATIMAAEFSPLRSEAEDLVRAMKKAGVAVAYHTYGGVTQGFFKAAAVVDKAGTAQRIAGLELRQALAILP